MLAVPQDEYDRRPDQKWYRLTICLSVFVFLLGVVAIILTTILVLQIRENNLLKNEKEEKLNICTTRDCVVTASTLLEVMDPSADPCKDFYQFSCGAFNGKHPVPDHKSRENTFFQYKDFYERQLRDLVEDVDTTGKPEVISRAQEAYHVCLNTSYQPKAELAAFRKFLEEDLGGWPLIVGSSWIPRFTLEEFFGKIQRLGYAFGFAQIVILRDFENIKQKALYILPKDPSSDELIDDSTQSLTKHISKRAVTNPGVQLIIDIAKKLSRTSVKIDPKEIMTSFQIITKMSGLTMDYPAEEGEEEENTGEEDDKEAEDESNGEEDEVPLEGAFTLKQLNDFGEGEFNWLKMVNAKFEGIRKFTEENKILTHRLYIRDASALLTQYSTREITNALIVKIILHLVNNGGPDLEPIWHNYLQKVNERDKYQIPTKWSECTNWIQKVYPLPVTRLFVEKYVDPKGRNMAIEMIDLVRESYKGTIERSKWLDPKTRERALHKLKLMAQHVSYPEFIFDDKKLEDEYSYLPTVRSIHFLNEVESRLNKTTKALQKFKDPVNPSEWTFNPLKINAFYNRQSNSIWFPTGILQLPFFDETRPAAVNYAMVGTSIGHEIGHAFDVSGSQYDEIGQTANWWAPGTSEKYQKQSECFLKQYNVYCPEELDAPNETVCVDGEHTLGENTADNTGMRASLEAYKKWEKIHGEEKRLPGLEQYTSEQIFFLSYGYLWCENLPPENWEPIYGKNEHTASKYRVLGVLSNTKEFAEAFHCPVGKMNRGEKRCELW